MNSSVTTAGIAQSLKVSRRNALKMITMGMVFGLATTPFAPASSGHAADVKGKKTLIVYFSMPETNNPDNMTREEDNSVVVIDGKVLGNTQYVAQLIQEMTGGDIFRILPQKPRSSRSLRHHLYRVSKLVGRHADDSVHVSGTVRFLRQDTYSLLHPRRQRLFPHHPDHTGQTARRDRDTRRLLPFPEPHGTRAVRRGGMAEGNRPEKIRRKP